MGLSSNALRVSVSRLKRARFVQCDAQGRYALGPTARALSAQVESWRQVESQTRRWDGTWVAIHLDALSSRQRALATSRSRALRLLGFAQWREGLCVRPNNLRGGLASLRERLTSLEVDPAQPVFCLSEAREDLPALWDVAALNRGYEDGLRALEESRRALDTLGLEAAAALSFRVGGQAFRQLAFDPLLPPPIVDDKARARFVAAVAEYDKLGRDLWSRVLDTPLQAPKASKGRSRARRAGAPGLHLFSTDLA